MAYNAEIYPFQTSNDLVIGDDLWVLITFDRENRK